MRLHPTTGAGAMGFATNISIDGVVPPPLVGVGAQMPRWFDPAGNVLLFFHVASSALQTIDLDTNVVTTIDTDGCVTLGAGNNLYVASLSGGSVQGVRSNIVGWNRLPLAGLGDMDESGDFAVIQAFAADRGISIYTSGGALVTTIDIPIAPGATIRCKNGLVAFSGSASAWELHSLVDGSAMPFGVREQGVIETVPLQLADGRIFVVERTGNDTLTLREAIGNQGYVISSVITYNPDVMELSPGVIRVGYSATAGEGPTQLRMVDVTLGTGGTTLWSTASGTLVSTPGTPLPIESMPATLTNAGGLGLVDTFLGRTAWVKEDRTLTEYAWQFLAKLVAHLGQPVNLATQTTGVLGPSQGGTGGNSGTSIINAGNVTLGSLPQNVKWQQYDTSATGTQHDFVFSLGTTQADVLRCENTSLLTLTGLQAGIPGQRLVVLATDADVTLEQEGASSDAAARIRTFSGLDVTITIEEAAYLIYDGTETRWRLVLVSAAGGAVTSTGYWSPLTAGPTLNWGEINSQVGYWSPLMTGPDAATSELVLTAEGDTVAIYTQVQDGPYLPPLVDNQADTVSVFTPTP